MKYLAAAIVLMLLQLALVYAAVAYFVEPLAAIGAVARQL